jgi:hypothetical protein
MKTANQTKAVKYPYARIGAMGKLMESIRDGWKPSQVDVNLIKTLAVASSKEREVLQTLKFIGAVDTSGATTEVWDQLKQEYRRTLAHIVREKYSDLFNQIPVKLITQDSVVNYFMKTGTGVDTAEYQGILFGWFCREAGIEVPNLPESFERARFGKKKYASNKRAKKADNQK